MFILWLNIEKYKIKAIYFYGNLFFYRIYFIYRNSFQFIRYIFGNSRRKSLIIIGKGLM